MVLRGRGRRSARSVAEVNDRRDDPYAALGCAVDYLKSVLRPAINRNPHYGAAWCWVVVHIIDAAAMAIENRAQPHPWFRTEEARRLNPVGWAPLAPVTAMLRVLARPPGQEGTRP